MVLTATPSAGPDPQNRFAHRLDAEVTEEDRTVFLATQLFSAFERAAPLDPDEDIARGPPIEVLERFARFAGTLLSAKASPLSIAFGRALRERWSQSA